MTQEEKQLLIKDLCARLPYSIWGLHRGEDLPLYVIDDSGAYMVLGYNAWFNLDTVPFKPYLRPMSSMTKEEKMEVGKLGVCVDGAFHNDIYDTGISMEEAFTAISWLLQRHFDINYLIEKGLALEAPEGMYKTE